MGVCVGTALHTLSFDMGMVITCLGLVFMETSDFGNLNVEGLKVESVMKMLQV